MTNNKNYYVEHKLFNNQDGNLIITNPVGLFKNIDSAISLCKKIISDIKDIGDVVEEKSSMATGKNVDLCYNISMSNKDNKLTVSYNVYAMNVLN